jgi:hypothetical protein
MPCAEWQPPPVHETRDYRVMTREIVTSHTLAAFCRCFGMRDVAYFVEALRYKLESRGFESWWGCWISSIYLILPAALGPGVDSASNRNEYQKQKKKCFWGVERGRHVRVTTSPPSVSRVSTPVLFNMGYEKTSYGECVTEMHTYIYIYIYIS